ncbi:MAG: 30S ribosomal protein S9 [Patescibacteria group bacterium]
MTTPKTKTVKVTVRYTEAVGRRKTSVARVRIVPNPKQEITINDRPLDKYFPITDLQRIMLAPLAVSFSLPGEEANVKPTTIGTWSISVHVAGGGIHSQAEAIAMGLARALVKVEPGFRLTLKQNKFLTRDSRMKERRKFGLKKARKAPQWSKR